MKTFTLSTKRTLSHVRASSSLDNTGKELELELGLTERPYPESPHKDCLPNANRGVGRSAETEVLPETPVY